jgi:hypothetical protein
VITRECSSGYGFRLPKIFNLANGKWAAQTSVVKEGIPHMTDIKRSALINTIPYIVSIDHEILL